MIKMLQNVECLGISTMRLFRRMGLGRPKHPTKLPVKSQGWRWDDRTDRWIAYRFNSSILELAEPSQGDSSLSKVIRPRIPQEVLIEGQQRNQWAIIQLPRSFDETEVARCVSKEIAIALCVGMNWKYEIKVWRQR
jgi:hypothetical protein